MVEQLTLISEEEEIKILEKKDYDDLSIFEKQKLHNYRIKKKPKFEDEKGVIMLNGIEIRYNFNNNICDMCHIEFNSTKGSAETNDYVAIPNPISETGYRSHFFDKEYLEDFNTLKDFINHLADIFMEEENKARKIKIKRGQMTL